MTAAPPARRVGRPGGVTVLLGALALALAGAGSAEEGPRPRAAGDGEGARARTVVEEMIAATNPCASLRTEVGGQPIGLDSLDDVEIRAADASLAGDAVTLTFNGRLACRTPAGALFQGDAASDFAATAALSLADCAAAEVRVALSDFGGSFAAFLEALRPTIEARIAAAARPELVAACRDFTGR